MEFTIQVTKEELDVIAVGLSEVAWKLANPLLVKLKNQVDAQTRPTTQETESDHDGIID